MGDGPATGIPGVPGWRLPPIEAAWQGLSTAQLCLAIKSPKTNGGRDLPELIKHLDEDALVLWGWQPGAQRTPPPISHKEFVDLGAVLGQHRRGVSVAPKSSTIVVELENLDQEPA